MKKTHDNILYYDFNYDYPVIDYAKGSYVYDINGTAYLDGSSGPISVSLAYGREDMAKVLYDQARNAAYYHRDAVTSPLAERVAEHMHQCFGMDRFCIVSGGSEANELAARLARLHYYYENKKTKHIIISRWMSYHGFTLGALGLSGHPQRRKEYHPDICNDHKIAPPYCYRCWYGKEPSTCNCECAQALEHEIELLGEENVAGFIFEPVSGTSLAAVVPPKKYFERIREICDKYDILMIADEVMCGSGRTGTFTTCEQFGVKPDIMTLAKSISGGYFPVGVTTCTQKVASPIIEYGYFGAGFTWTGNPLASAVVDKTLSIITEENLLQNVQEMGKRLVEGLTSLKEKHVTIGDVRGLGLMVGIEFVKDQRTKEFLDPSLNFGQKFEDMCRDHRLFVLNTARFDKGKRGDGTMVGPNFEVSPAEIEQIITIIDEVLTEMESTLPQS